MILTEQNYREINRAIEDLINSMDYDHGTCEAACEVEVENEEGSALIELYVKVEGHFEKSSDWYNEGFNDTWREIRRDIRILSVEAYNRMGEQIPCIIDINKI